MANSVIGLRAFKSLKEQPWGFQVCTSRPELDFAHIRVLGLYGDGAFSNDGCYGSMRCAPGQYDYYHLAESCGKFIKEQLISRGRAGIKLIFVQTFQSWLSYNQNDVDQKDAVLDAMDLSADQVTDHFGVIINKLKPPEGNTNLVEYERFVKMECLRQFLHTEYLTSHVELNASTEHRQEVHHDHNETVRVSSGVMSMIHGLPILTLPYFKML